VAVLAGDDGGIALLTGRRSPLRCGCNTAVRVPGWFNSTFLKHCLSSVHGSVRRHGPFSLTVTAGKDKFGVKGDAAGEKTEVVPNGEDGRRVQPEGLAHVEKQGAWRRGQSGRERLRRGRQFECKASATSQHVRLYYS
jgi:hypothetical protein